MNATPNTPDEYKSWFVCTGHKNMAWFKVLATIIVSPIMTIISKITDKQVHFMVWKNGKFAGIFKLV